MSRRRRNTSKRRRNVGRRKRASRRVKLLRKSARKYSREFQSAMGFLPVPGTRIRRHGATYRARPMTVATRHLMRNPRGDYPRKSQWPLVGELHGKFVYRSKRDGKLYTIEDVGWPHSRERVPFEIPFVDYGHVKYYGSKNPRVRRRNSGNGWIERWHATVYQGSPGGKKLVMEQKGYKSPRDPGTFRVKIGSKVLYEGRDYERAEAVYMKAPLW